MARYQDGGEALLQAFRSLDVDHIFCSSGSEWAPIWEAMARQEVEGVDGPQYHDFMHETLAVGMAIGCTLVTGKMQAVLLHAVPGLLQGSCGIHGALLSEVPMLVLSSEANSYGDRDGVDPGSQWYRNLSIVGGPHSVVDNIVKWSCQIPGIETLYEFTKRAGELAQRTPKGPVYLNAPVEVLLEEWNIPNTLKNTAAPSVPVAPESDVTAMVDMINAARHPIIITESVGRTAGGHAAMIRFAEAYGIPVYESQASVSCNFPHSHPLYQGGNPDATRDSTDLILLINCRSPWYPPSNIFPNAKVCVVDEMPQRPHIVHQVLQADQYVEGAVPAALNTAADRADPGLYNARRDAAHLSHTALESNWKKAEDKAAAADGIEAIHVAACLRDALPKGTKLFDESITHSRIVQAHLRPEDAGSYSYVQGGLGQGIGVALGGKIGASESFVAMTVGDGAFLYNPIVQSLTASKELNLPILIVVFNNGQYLSMKYNHMRFYPDGQSKENETFHGVELAGQPDLDALAGPCGAKGIAVRQKADLNDAISEAIATVEGGQTCILNIHVTR